MRIENLVEPGTPDVNYRDGWIELKYIPAWPKRAETMVKIDHYTPQQRAWAIRRGHVGGKVSLLLVVGDEWLLFSGKDAAYWLGETWTRAACMRFCLKYWPKKPTQEDFQAWLP